MITGNAPFYIIAEIGINHNGDMSLAVESIVAAKKAGAHAVKFQNYYTEDFLLDDTLKITYENDGKTITEPQYDLFKRCELSEADVRYLAEVSAQEGVDFFSTPTNDKGVELLCELGVPYLKNGSDYLSNLELIDCMARSGVPTILSTGMATLSDIDDAVSTFYQAGGQDLVLMHCTSAYPTPPEDVNLKRIQTLKNAFDCRVGLSDHTAGITAALGSLCFGACMVEKHFTLDKTLPGPDHAFSMDPVELTELSSAVMTLSQQLGTPEIRYTASEAYGRENYRLSCMAKVDILSGETLLREHIAFMRPGSGIPPKNIGYLLGRRLKKPIKKGQVIELAMLQ